MGSFDFEDVPISLLQARIGDARSESRHLLLSEQGKVGAYGMEGKVGSKSLTSKLSSIESFNRSST